MKKTDTHSKIQETVDGSRLMQAGIRTNDPEIVSAGWKRIENVRGGNFAKKMFDTFREMFAKQNPEGNSPENKG